ncbi:hypothetical protein GWI33_008630 [Rhynchophorus ferrugineus]|uniref:Exonuclease domain-containing protein n=1 Tax=Rhynchophorus ferrugineus TaxID=354439 RepID=A0A834ICQ0_RHYFE|nr:hypothetical protein GWI33_008630 [Rhynchophorus ferrugineus]
MEKNTFMKSGIFAIWSDWDLKQCLTVECKRKNIYRDLIFRRWINIRKLFISQTNFRGGLLQALRHVGLSFEGQQHCGLHDARNTARLVGLLLTRGMKLRVTSDFTHIH